MTDYMKQLEEVQQAYKDSHEKYGELVKLVEQSKGAPENHERLTKLFSILADDLERAKIVAAYAEISGNPNARRWADVSTGVIGAKTFMVYMLARREGYPGIEITLKPKAKDQSDAENAEEKK